MLSDVDVEEKIELQNIRSSSISVRSSRTLADDQNIKELASSIRQHGLLQPITVRPIEKHFEIVAGHRRFKACKLLRWRVIPTIVRQLSDKDAFEIQLVENIHRLTMDPIEEAQAFKKYILDYGWGGVSELARIISKSEQYVSSRIQILRLPKEILENVTHNKLKPSHAIELVNLNNDAQKLMTNLIVNNNLSVRSIRDIIRHSKQRQETSELIDQVMIYEHDETTPPIANQSTISEQKLLKKSLLCLRIVLVKIDGLIDEADKKLENDDRIELIQKLMRYRLQIHSIIDENIKAIAEVNKRL